MKLDSTSLKIVSRLLMDGRLTHQALADEFNYSRPAIHQRINKLEGSGVIKGYKADVDFRKLGFNIETFVIVNIHTLDYNETISSILDLSEEGVYVEKVFRITGENCIMVKLLVASTEHLRKFHDKILKIEGLVETNTMMVMQEEDNVFEGRFAQEDADE
ncbi:MAG: Lrp/AsnC family transcriptional regulator [Tissierellia bacterium]|nr:Lrp/AsnC family transcriptional regulator [Tissierellia bacterium]